MLKKLGLVTLVLMLCVAMGAFATETKSSQFPWMASYDQPGKFESLRFGRFLWTWH